MLFRIQDHKKACPSRQMMRKDNVDFVLVHNWILDVAIECSLCNFNTHTKCTPLCFCFSDGADRTSTIWKEESNKSDRWQQAGSPGSLTIRHREVGRRPVSLYPMVELNQITDRLPRNHKYADLQTATQAITLALSTGLENQTFCCTSRITFTYIWVRRQKQLSTKQSWTVWVHNGLWMFQKLCSPVS